MGRFLVMKLKVGKHIERSISHKTIYDEIGWVSIFTARGHSIPIKVKGWPGKRQGFGHGSAVIGKWLPKNNF